MSRVPVAEGVFTWPSEEPRLIGGRCAACGIVTFPVQDSCPRCPSTEMEKHLLSRRGRLWAWTTQEFPPPSPPYTGPTGKAFEPYAVGYVELAGDQPRGASADQPHGASADQPRGASAQVRVETRLTEMKGLETGMEMELVLIPFRTDDAGNEVVTFAFRPLGDSPSGA